MNIDERIGALTRSVELLSQMHQDNERAYQQRFLGILDALQKLAAIAESHRRRIFQPGERALST